MESFTDIVVILLALGFLYLFMKPYKQPKSKVQKQDEIRLKYQQRLSTELLKITDAQERQKRKMALLKVFAKELEFNIFFDTHEIKTLMRELAGY